MRNLGILVMSIMMGISCFTYAQAEQKIRILEYNGKQQKTPVATVEIAVANAQSTVSDAQGNATLRFRTLHAGDAVKVRRIDKSGYEIFNKEAVEQWVLSPSNTFTIVLCRSDRFKNLCDNYMKVSSESYAAQLKKEQARLATEKKNNKLKEEEYQQKLQEAQDAYDEQLEKLDNYVDRFARIDLSEISEQEQAIIDLVQEGKIDEAIARYEEMDLIGKYIQQSGEIRQIKNANDSLDVIRTQKEAARDTLKKVIDLMKKE